MIGAKVPGHPGKTAAQRRALDLIGCGNFSPIISKATRDALLRQGLIEQCGTRLVGIGPLTVRVAEYQMPFPVHIAWCTAVAADEPEPALSRQEPDRG